MPRVLGIHGAPIERTVWRYLAALPQYNVGHAQRVKEIREAESAFPGLWPRGELSDGALDRRLRRIGFSGGGEVTQPHAQLTNQTPAATDCDAGLWQISVAMHGTGEGSCSSTLSFGFLAVLLLGALAGAIYQKIGLRRDTKLHPPPGRFINLGTHRLHLLEKGQPSPTIVLEAGLMSTMLSWSAIQSRLAQTYRVVSYDRAGLGWSDLGPMPRTADRMVEELHTLLERAAIPPPYVLVGHSFGGLTMPLFAARYPQETLGVVLVDPVAPAEWNPPSDTGPQARRDRRHGISPRRVALSHRRHSFRSVPAYFGRNETGRTYWCD